MSSCFFCLLLIFMRPNTVGIALAWAVACFLEFLFATPSDKCSLLVPIHLLRRELSFFKEIPISILWTVSIQQPTLVVCRSETLCWKIPCSCLLFTHWTALSSQNIYGADYMTPRTGKKVQAKYGTSQERLAHGIPFAICRWVRIINRNLSGRRMLTASIIAFNRWNFIIGQELRY